LDRIVALRSKSAQSPAIHARLFTLIRVGDQGSALLELAMVLPILLLIMTGIFTFSIALNNYQMLTYALNQGGTILQELPGMPSAADPCLAAASAVMGAAPNLLSSGASGLQLTVQLDNGAASYGPASASTISCPAGSAYLVPDTNATITATYSCNLTVFGVNYAPSCKMSASTTELMQ
jgi:Flp pilus assembly protein TadG